MKKIPISYIISLVIEAKIEEMSNWTEAQWREAADILRSPKPTEWEKMMEKSLHQEVFLFYDFEETRIRMRPTKNVFVRWRNKKETPLDVSTKLYAETLLNGKEITKEEYYGDMYFSPDTLNKIN